MTGLTYLMFVDNAGVRCYQITGYTGSNPDVIIPDTYNNKPVTRIGDGAFAGCSLLESIVIPNSVTSIGEFAFDGCSLLTKVNYLGTIDQWVQIEFGNLFTNPLYYAKKLYINNELITEANITKATKINAYAFRCCSSLTSVVIGDSVTSIGERAFSECSSLTSIVIENSVTNIGDYAFSSCTSLTSVTIGDSVTSIGYCAFAWCSSLNYNIKDDIKYLGNSNNPYLYLAGVVDDDITTATIDSGCRFIGSDAFYDCNSLTSIVIPDSVTSISDHAFWYCSSLTSIEIPNSVTSIGESAFEYCSSLESIEIPDSVTSIGLCAFSGCDSLISITIGNSVTSIGDYAFSCCYSLTDIIIVSQVPPNISNSVFYLSDRIKNIYCPEKSLEVYKNATNWYALADKFIGFKNTVALSFILNAIAQKEHFAPKNILMNGNAYRLRSTTNSSDFGCDGTITFVLED